VKTEVSLCGIETTAGNVSHNHRHSKCRGCMVMF